MHEQTSHEHAALEQPHTTLPLSGRAVLIGMALLVGVLALLALTGLTSNVWVQVVILGVVQGLTEFLPISSTAHLLITADLLGFEHSLGGTFEIFIQLGTVIAVVVFYLRELLAQVRGVRTQPEVRHFWLCILLAFIPAAVVGLTLRDWIKQVLFETPTVIASSLIIGGIIFIVLERLPIREATTSDETRVSFRQALAIGVAQVFALIPGTSRSGSSIVGGLLAGLDRRAATAFSFYLAIPTLGAATVVDLLASLDQVTMDDAGRLLVGTVVAGVVGWLSIGWLLHYVSRNSFVSFGIYRLLAGAAILLLVAVGRL